MLFVCLVSLFCAVQYRKDSFEVLTSAVKQSSQFMSVQRGLGEDEQRFVQITANERKKEIKV